MRVLRLVVGRSAGVDGGGGGTTVDGGIPVQGFMAEGRKGLFHDHEEGNAEDISGVAMSE